MQILAHTRKNWSEARVLYPPNSRALAPSLVLLLKNNGSCCVKWEGIFDPYLEYSIKGISLANFYK